MKVADTSTRILQKIFSPGNYDVICGRGKGPTNHIGNKRFKIVIKNYYERYANAETKFKKSLLVSEIVNTIRENSGEGGFVKFNPINGGYWYEVGDQLAREKVSQELRNLLFNQYKSSNVQKLRIRKERRKNEISNILSASSSYDLTSISSLTLRKGNDFTYAPIKNVLSSTSSSPSRYPLNPTSFEDSFEISTSKPLQEMKITDHPDILMSNPSATEIAAGDRNKFTMPPQARADQDELEIKRKQVNLRLSAIKNKYNFYSALYKNEGLSLQSCSAETSDTNTPKSSTWLNVEDELCGFDGSLKEAYTSHDALKDTLGMTFDFPGIAFSPRPFNEIYSKAA